MDTSNINMKSTLLVLLTLTSCGDSIAEDVEDSVAEDGEDVGDSVAEDAEDVGDSFVEDIEDIEDIEDLEFGMDTDERAAIAFSLYKVRRCNNLLCIGSSLTRGDFSYWETYGVSNANQKDTYIGTLLEPARANTRRLVIVLAGQNGIADTIGSGVGDDVVGSQHNWHEGWPNDRASEGHTINDNSIAEQLYDQFDQTGNTFMAVSWAHAMNWNAIQSQKTAIEDAFYYWLLSKADANNIDEVLIIGFSRGGCFALRLAERFNRNLTSADVAVMSVDAVCNEGEFNTTSVKLSNPNNGAYQAVTTDFRSNFSREGHHLYVHNVVSGHKNFVLSNIVGLSHDNASTDPYDWDGWYHQDWVNQQHTSVDNAASWNDGGITFYNDAQLWFADSCNNPCPHGGWFDGVHCTIGTAPIGTTAFIWGSGFYHTPLAGNNCPIAGSWYDSANCYVAPAVAADDPFIYHNGWYYSTEWTPCWTQWYDRDNPSGSGDYEDRASQVGVCANPVEVECETTSGLDAASTGEVITCTPSGGLVCVNSNQPDGVCNYDYRVRFGCP